MRCPSLTELPAPPAGKTGWPWTEESLRPEAASSTRLWPRITIVTPSFNQGRFFEETIRSILLQGYPDLEYFVLDGGSTDNSVDIIRKYSPWIRFWVSERDGGQSAAINRGLRMGSGTLATWINSDDILCKNALTNHVLQHSAPAVPGEDVVYIGDCVNIDEASESIRIHRGWVRSLEDLLRVRSVWRCGGSIDQPAVLFPLQGALRVGGLNETNHFTMDYELWGKFFLAGARVRYTEIPFGCFRFHSEQKTQNVLEQTKSMLDTAIMLTGLANRLTPEVRKTILADLEAYRKEYPKLAWAASGRLARIGLPPLVVLPIRKLRGAVERIFRHFKPHFNESTSAPEC